MAETAEKIAPKDPDEASEASRFTQPPPPMWMRALLGFAGLSLLVGFFLPWVRHAATAEGVAETTESGLTLAFSVDGIQGTPAIIVLVVPVLGALLSAISFMGLRYAAQTAIAVAFAILGYALYVLGTMFVQNTDVGLWVVSIGTFITLLLGVATWMLARRDAMASPPSAPVAPAKK